MLYAHIPKLDSSAPCFIQSKDSREATIGIAALNASTYYLTYYNTELFPGTFFMQTNPSAHQTSAPKKQHKSDEIADIPLVVDLDGTLVRSDLLYESFFDTAVLGIRFAFGTIQALVRGKAAVKRYLAAASMLDYTTLPYENCIVDLIREAKGSRSLGLSCDGF
jgi:hypothetical protein